MIIMASREGVILSNGGGSGDDGDNGDGGPLVIIMVGVVCRRHMFRQWWNFLITVSKFVNKTGKCGGDCSKCSGKGGDFDHRTRKALSYNLLKDSTICTDWGGGGKSLRGARPQRLQEKHSGGREGGVQHHIAILYSFFLDNIVEELTRNMILIKPG